MIQQEDWIQYRIMERLENELSLTYLSRGQSMLMMKCVAEQILGNWLEILSTYIETYLLNFEVMMEAELNEFRHARNSTCKCSKEKQVIEFKDCLTLMMKLGIIGKAMTWYEETVNGTFCCVM